MSRDPLLWWAWGVALATALIAGNWLHGTVENPAPIVAGRDHPVVAAAPPGADGTAAAVGVQDRAELVADSRERHCPAQPANCAGAPSDPRLPGGRRPRREG